ncbi:MAG TPA: hypothetical protein VF329_04110 [Gammaproteobacteria bacterium]
MRSPTTFPALLIGILSLPAFADCEQPPLVMLPGAEEDVAGREDEILEETQEYFQAMQEYVECIRDELESAGGDQASELYRQIMVQRNNRAVAEAEAVQRWFNTRFPSAPTVEAPAEGQED